VLRKKSGRLERALGARFRDPDLLRLALTHRSHAFEHGLGRNNERLEFLGDAVLGLVVTDLAYDRFPELSEGDLAKLRAATVNMATLAEVAKELELGDELLLGKGEEQSGGRAKASILGDALEAVIGALYLDRGIAPIRRLVNDRFWPRMVAYVGGGGERDYKTGLQELAARDGGGVPQYRVSGTGPDHAKEFTATVYLGDRAYGTGRGRSKKEAEQEAARAAHARLTEEVYGAVEEREA
jgi:ribonuclease III